MSHDYYSLFLKRSSGTDFYCFRISTGCIATSKIFFCRSIVTKFQLLIMKIMYVKMIDLYLNVEYFTISFKRNFILTAHKLLKNASSILPLTGYRLMLFCKTFTKSLFYKQKDEHACTSIAECYPYIYSLKMLNNKIKNCRLLSLKTN